uniref:Uncharacterized protein n=1 Tax=Cacopsylla melanoneura TaxID=428564 RepID=A0A8D8ZLU8_9HEMI
MGLLLLTYFSPSCSTFVMNSNRGVCFITTIYLSYRVLFLFMLHERQKGAPPIFLLSDFFPSSLYFRDWSTQFYIGFIIITSSIKSLIQGASSYFILFYLSFLFLSQN